MQVVSHSGGFAAICYALPIIWAPDGGELTLTPSVHTHQWMTPDRFRVIAPCCCQPYLSRMDSSEFPRGLNLDEWRYRPRERLNLSDHRAQIVSMSHPEREQPWWF